MIPLRFNIAFVAGMAAWSVPATLFCQEVDLKGWVSGLSSEEFKERVTAQDHIQMWADANPDKGKDFLLLEYQGSRDPEARMRLRETLKGLVVSEHQRTMGQGYLGITMGDILGGQDPDNSGVLVSLVVPDSPAETAGVKVNDVILALGKRRWNGLGATEALVAEVKTLKPGSEMPLEILRGGEKIKISVKLGARPMGLPERQPARFLNGMAPLVPDLGALQKLEDEAREEFFRAWLEEKKAKSAPR